MQGLSMQLLVSYNPLVNVYQLTHCVGKHEPCVSERERERELSVAGTGGGVVAVTSHHSQECQYDDVPGRQSHWPAIPRR